jgi:hypothetical protein
VDNTNPKPQDRLKYIEWFKEYNFEISGYYFEPDFEGSVERNEQRSGKAHIPLVGIKSTLQSLIQPDYVEGFDKLYRVNLTDEQGFVITKL